jgi:hypothetical protein
MSRPLSFVKSSMLLMEGPPSNMQILTLAVEKNVEFASQLLMFIMPPQRPCHAIKEGFITLCFVACSCG